MIVGIAGPLSATSERPKLSPGSGPLELIFDEPASIVEVYRAWGKITDIDVLTDPELREQAKTVWIQGKTGRIGLDGLAQLYAHFHLVLDEHTIVVVDDTPEKRLEYQALEVESFFVKHAASPAMLDIVKRMIGWRHATTDAALGRVTLMDTPRRLEIARDILRMVDTPKPEVMIEIELLAIQRPEDASALPQRLSADEKREFERSASARTVAKSRVNAFGGASTHLPVDGAPPETGIDLELKARRDFAPAVVQGDTVAEIILDLHLRASGVLGVVENDGREVPAYNRRQLATTVRLRAGETYLLPGLAPASGELVVALTPQRVRPAKGSGGAPMIWMEPSDELNLDAVWSRPNKAISDRERVRERLRERLRSLPRGLQDAEPSEQQEQNDP